MKTIVEHENDEFLVISLKHVSSLTVIVNRTGAPKLWEIAHENGYKTRKQLVFRCGLVVIVNLPRTPKTVVKHKNDEFLVISLKHLSSLTSHLSLPNTPKLWEIAHENGLKTRKQ